MEDALAAVCQPLCALFLGALRRYIVPHLCPGGKGQPQTAVHPLRQRVQLLRRQSRQRFRGEGGGLTHIPYRRHKGRAEFICQRLPSLAGEEDQVLAAGVDAAHCAGGKGRTSFHQNALFVHQIPAGEGRTALDRKVGEDAQKAGVAALVVLGLYGASNYMLNYSLNYPKEERMTAEHWKNRMKNECPWMVGWMDSVYQHHCVKDTFVVMPSGYKAHAIYLYAPKTTEKTAVVVHGYQVRSEGMLHIAYLYNHDMRYNVLLPDLYGHGESEGDHIQMGWKDRWDVIRWSEIANEIFKVKGEGQRVKNQSSLDDGNSLKAETRQVIHGISMGAATTMAVSGEKTPDYVKCFVEDCGYTSVWGEFAAQLKDQFGLPAFPLMNTTSHLLVCC